MPLIKCNECGNMVSDKAERCPRCGNPIGQYYQQPLQPQQAWTPDPYGYQPPNNEKKYIWLYAAIGVLAAIVLAMVIWMWNISSSSKEDKTANTPEEIPAQELAQTQNAVAPANNGPQKLRVSSAVYHYSLAPQAGNTYEARNLLDGNKATAWAVRLDDGSAPFNSDGSLDGPVFTLNCKKLSHIIIRNGYHKNSNSFYNNTRAAGITFYNGNGEVLYNGPLKDSQSPQRLDIPSNLSSNKNITQIGMRFNWGFKYGLKWNDLSVSEVEFWGYN